MRDYTHDSRAPLERCKHKNLKRQIGVTAGQPYEHRGMGGALYVEVARETIAVNTRESARIVPEVDVDAAIRTMTESTIADLDATIAELQEHRARLAGDPWRENSIQFPRLLAEVSAVIEDRQIAEIAISMGLPESKVRELFAKERGK